VGHNQWANDCVGDYKRASPRPWSHGLQQPTLPVGDLAQDPVMTNFKEYGFRGVIAKPLRSKSSIRLSNLAMVRSTRTVH
jgi:hypothetical protein